MSDPPFLKNNHPILTTPPFFMGKILTSPFGKNFGSRGGVGGLGGGGGVGGGSYDANTICSKTSNFIKEK